MVSSRRKVALTFFVYQYNELSRRATTTASSRNSVCSFLCCSLFSTRIHNTPFAQHPLAILFMDQQTVQYNIARWSAESEKEVQLYGTPSVATRFGHASALSQSSSREHKRHAIVLLNGMVNSQSRGIRGMRLYILLAVGCALCVAQNAEFSVWYFVVFGSCRSHAS
jgi:hypothetical protein